MSLAGAIEAAHRDDEYRRTYRAFQNAQRDYERRPTVANYQRFVSARDAMLKTWGASIDAA